MINTGLINITNSIPSSLVVGTAEVSVPLVESLKQILNEIANLATGSATALMVFLIIATVAQGIVAIASREYSLFSPPPLALELLRRCSAFNLEVHPG